MTKLSTRINKIGSRLVSCTINCVDISNIPSQGIIPRALFLEEKNRKGEIGCVMVGINPGPCAINSPEANYYLKNGVNYNSVVGYFQECGSVYKYYRHLRDFINCMGLTGPILWTELVKCQCASGTKHLSLNTSRICANEYLKKEIDIVPENWPIIAAGSEPYNLLKYIFLTRPVLGIPHTNTRGEFPNMFEGKGRTKFTLKIENQINTFNQGGNIAMWLKS
jgi:hypothetical protein